MIYGGAAGGGKSWSLLVEPLRHIHRPDFSAVIFRRTHPQIIAPGGLWDASARIYSLLNAEPNLGTLSWKFASGARVRFSHLQYDQNVYDWKSSEIPLIEFDQLEDFTEVQFFYMLSRNRSTCGIRPYIRGGCNPQPGWLADFVSWWIDDETGYARPDRAGAIRWFVRIEDRIIWADTPDGFPAEAAGIPPKSVAFCPAKLTDNQALMRSDPGYLANLMAMCKVDRERLLGGNWKISDLSGAMIEQGWLRLADVGPIRANYVRYWDKAGTPGDGDYSAGVLMCRDSRGMFYVMDVVRGQWSAGQRNAIMKQTAQLDRKAHGWVQTWIEEEPGSGGKESAENSIRDLAGFDVHAEKVTGDKPTRFKPFAAQAEAGNICVLNRAWTKAYLDEITTVFKGAHDDQADASGGALNKLAAMGTPSDDGGSIETDDVNILDQFTPGTFG